MNMNSQKGLSRGLYGPYSKFNIGINSKNEDRHAHLRWTEKGHNYTVNNLMNSHSFDSYISVVPVVSLNVPTCRDSSGKLVLSYDPPPSL